MPRDDERPRKSKKEKKVKKEKKSKKERRKRPRSPSASDGSGSDSDGGAARQALKAMRRAEMEEKLQKKAEKRRQEKLMSTFGYTNDINPFGDSNLNGRFVWRKKEMKSGGKGKLRSLKQADAEDEAQIAEITAVRERRKRREEDLKEMDRQRQEEARQREADRHAEWAEKEEAFHLEANQTRSKIRLLEGRAEPIDILARNVLLFGGEKRTVGISYTGDTASLDISSLGVELKAPTEVFKDLSLPKLERLRGQIDEYLQLEGESGSFKDFWQSLGVVCDFAIDQKRRSAEKDGDARPAFDPQEIEQELEACSDEELEALKQEVRQEMAAGGDEYWDMVSEHLVVQLAKRRLHAMHVKMLTQQMEKAEEQRDRTSKNGGKAASRKSFFFRNAKTEEEQAPEDDNLDDSLTAIALQRAEEAREMAENEERMKLTDVVDEDDEQHATMAAPIKDEKTSYAWADKYRPRKPRFFNRVRTGYDWNLYNRTHYDHDNPPPKTVQGYKFNLFYPDLIDKSQTPTYRLEEADSPQFAIIRFSAGPPYEDIAFKIVNREWAVGRKKGFRCSFERGVLQLHFNFKRARYRR